MKNFLLTTLFLSFQFYFFSQECCIQNDCYVRLNDISGVNTDEYQGGLKTVACNLINNFPDNFKDSFKIYDFGFYSNNEYFEGNFSDMFPKIIDEVQQQSPYYLLFGKQTDNSGIYTKFWIELKLPQNGQFSCMTDLDRDIYLKRIQNATDEKYLEFNKTFLYYSQAEIAGIAELDSIISEIKDCCLISGIQNRSNDCSECSNEKVKKYFEIQQFDKIELDIIAAPKANIDIPLVKDLSYHKVNINNINDYLGNHLSVTIEEFNKWISFNILISSNESFCSDSMVSKKMNEYKFKNDFFCYINFPEGQGVKQNDIKITWNKKSDSWIKKQTTADIIISLLRCKLNKTLGVKNENCFNTISLPPSYATSTSDPNFDIIYALYLQESGLDVNILDLIAAYDEYGDIPPTGIFDPIPEISNGIDIINSHVPSLYDIPSNLKLIGFSPTRHPVKGNQKPEDLDYGTDGNCKGIIRSCMTEWVDFNSGNIYQYTENNLFDEMTNLFHLTSTSPLQAVCDDYIQRFRSKNSTDYFHHDLSEEVRKSPEMRNYMKLFGYLLNKEIKGNINFSSIKINMDKIHPVFKSNMEFSTSNKYNLIHGLQILINDTEATNIWNLGNLGIDLQTGEWTGTFIFEVTDHFGLDKDDVLKYQQFSRGFAAWWVLQHKKNYPAFRSKIWIIATLRGNTNN
jgi:hypothetical protein